MTALDEQMIACQTPLVELLEGVPADASMTYEHHSTHHQMIPVGRLCHEAAAELRGSRSEPSIFDLLEPLSAALIEHGGPDIRGGFARGTGGVDLPYIVETLSVMAGKVAELVEALREIAELDPLLPKKAPATDPTYGFRAAQSIAAAALAPYPEGTK